MAVEKNPGTPVELALQPSASVKAVQTPDGAAILDIRQGLCFALNPVAGRVWSLLKTAQSLDEITDQIAAEFAVPKPQVQMDVQEFIQKLKHHGLMANSECQQATERSVRPNRIWRILGRIQSR